MTADSNPANAQSGDSSAQPSAPTRPALLRTPLFDTHRASGAKLVDFGGWEMPLNYGSQVEEHHTVRRSVGLFDVSHMCNVDVTGEGARAYLRRLLANDIEKLQLGQALYSCMLNPEGGVIDDLIVYRRPDDRGYRIVVNASTAPTDLAWMTKIASEEGFSVQIQARRDLAMIAVQGPAARALVLQRFSDKANDLDALKPFYAHFDGDWLFGRTGYTGEDGFELVMPAPLATEVWASLIELGAKPCGLGARDTLRLEAAMNLYGQDMDDRISPLAAGLAWTIDRKTDSAQGTRREFIGRTALEAAEATGLQPKLVGLKFNDKGVIRAHCAVRRVGSTAAVGEVTSGSFSPTLGLSIALARVPREVALGEVVEVELRGRWLPATVVKTPFVRNGQAL